MDSSSENPKPSFLALVNISGGLFFGYNLGKLCTTGDNYSSNRKIFYCDPIVWVKSVKIIEHYWHVMY